MNKFKPIYKTENKLTDAELIELGKAYQGLTIKYYHIESLTFLASLFVIFFIALIIGVIIGSLSTTI